MTGRMSCFPGNALHLDKADQSAKLVGHVILHCRLRAKTDNAAAIRCIIHKVKTLVNPICNNLHPACCFWKVHMPMHDTDMETCLS